MKKILSGRIIALFMALCFLCISVSASAEPLMEDAPDAGSIEVKTDPLLEGVQLALYRVGGYDNGSFALNDVFKDSGTDMTTLKEASQLAEAAAQLTAYAESQAITPQAAVQFDAEGKAVFEDVSADDALYLICQVGATDEFEVTPLIVMLPLYEDGTAKTELSINAKYIHNIPVEMTGAIILNKVNEKNEVLPGAVFSFEEKKYAGDETVEGVTYSEDENGRYFWNVISNSLTTDENGQIAAENLPLGTYRFVELKAPEGYILDSTPLLVDVENIGTIRQENGVYTAADGTPAVVTFTNTLLPDNPPPESSVPVDESSVPPPPESSVPTISVPEESSTPEPSLPPVVTGEDIAKFIIIGVVVAVSLVAVVLLFVLGRKKKNNDDDE